jgi:hypothetical protein
MRLTPSSVAMMTGNSGRHAGRIKSGDANLKVLSLRCDNTADAWYVVPDEFVKPDPSMRPILPDEV